MPKLTKSYVESIAAGDRDTVAFDSELPGFGVKVTPTGSRIFFFQYRLGGRGAKTRRVNLGRLGDAGFTAEKARREAEKWRGIVRAGSGDPFTIKAEEKAKHAKPIGRPDSIKNVFDEFERRHLEARGRRASYVKQTRRLFELYVFPTWQDRDVKSITRRDVVDLIEEVADTGKPIQANRVHSAVRKLFAWQMRREDSMTANPASGVDRPGEETQRERILSDDEIRIIWPQMEKLGFPWGRFMQQALISAQRRSEVARMRRADIDAEGLWSLAGELTKAGRPHVVPLSSLAREIIAGSPEIGPYIFSLGFRPTQNFSRMKADLDALVKTYCEAERLDPPARWTLHDLRRTAASGMGRLGVSRFVIGRVLNHADASVTGIYDRYEYLDEKRRALQVWSDHLGVLIGSTNGTTAPAQAFDAVSL